MKTNDELKKAVFDMPLHENGGDVVENDAEIIEYLLENCSFTIPKENRFFASMFCDTMIWVFWKRAEKYTACVDEEGLREGDNALAHTGILDFSHTNPEWQTILSLGIKGLRDRAENYYSSETDPSKKRFYGAVLRVYNAAIGFIKRVSEEARLLGRNEMADGLKAMTERAPMTLYEAMQTSIVYYMLQHMTECTYVRTLGRLDTLYYPFFKNENRADAESLIYDFYREIDTLRAPSNIPFAMGGTRADGSSLVNELSYLLLRTYRRAETNNTKFHILISDTTPDDLVKEALEAVIEGNNSIVFMSDTKIVESLVKHGADPSDARMYHVVGCYECGAEGELTCSTNARVNIPKAVEYVLNDGYDMLTGKKVGLSVENEPADFDTFFNEYLKQLGHLSKCAMQATDIYEKEYKHIHSSPFLSGTYTCAMEKGADLYCGYSAKYNNSSVNAIGLATAVDSLYAVKKLVYDDRTLTLSALRDILKNDWEGNEILRLRVKNRFKKYGNNDPEIDKLAHDTVKYLSEQVSGKPNMKGGKYRLGLFSINWRWDMGKMTSASADGRRKGETLSQNSSATFGADKNGATAHLLSAARIDGSDTPNASIVDIDLHISSVRGENGLNAMMGSLMTFFEMGGFGVHYNVLDTEVLKKAKASPKDYPNLQVRLCGWNVLFSSLSEKEQDEFIARSNR